MRVFAEFEPEPSEAIVSAGVQMVEEVRPDLIAETVALCRPEVIGAQYEIDLDFCKGCRPCAAECPCGAIEMTPEEI